MEREGGREVRERRGGGGREREFTLLAGRISKGKVDKLLKSRSMQVTISN